MNDEVERRCRAMMCIKIHRALSICGGFVGCCTYTNRCCGSIHMISKCCADSLAAELRRPLPQVRPSLVLHMLG